LERQEKIVHAEVAEKNNTPPSASWRRTPLDRGDYSF